MWKNIIKLNQDKNQLPDDYIIRQTRYVLYLIIFSALLMMLVMFSTLYRLISLQVDRTDIEGMLRLLGRGFIAIVVCIILFLWGFVIDRLVGYFYSVVVIEPTRVVHLSFRLFFREIVKIAELYRILSIKSKQSGIIQSVCNFGNISLQLQNDYIILLKNIPRPKVVVKKLETLKEHAIEQRVGDDDDKQLDQPDMLESDAAIKASSSDDHSTQESTGKDLSSDNADQNTSQLDSKKNTSRHDSLSQNTGDSSHQKYHQHTEKDNSDLKEEIKDDLKEEIKDEVIEEVKEEIEEERKN